jgi:hypothetical protein
MCNDHAHDQDMCHYMSGEFTAMAATRVAAKHCPKNNKAKYTTYFFKWFKDGFSFLIFNF